ncbi:MAG: hypothetical protein MIO90_01540 [Methanomassiliicoccales archaeon]|nr:hypothetical protein [Methanomassiliicoccales archaeon]
MQASLIEGPEGAKNVTTDVQNVRGRRKRATVMPKPAIVARKVPEVEVPVLSQGIKFEECPRLGPDGKCNGLYYGFTCIKDKCKMQNREATCEFCIGGDYCLKYNRFGCVGKDNCGTKDDYLSYIRKARENVEAYQ